MTTMTLNAAGTTDHRGHPVRAILPTHQLAAAVQALMPAIAWCQEHLLDTTGGFTLAMVPFSLLTWLFVAH